MKNVRCEEENLCTGGMIEYMKMEQGAWLEMYLADKSSPERGLSALMRLCQRFAARHGFSVQKQQYTKKDEDALQEVYVKFAIEFWEEHAHYPESAIYNVDETAIYFDTPPHKIWALKGRRGSAKVKHIQKNSGRLTAVLTIRADGKKLPILFILRGMPGGTVETDELPTYPSGHVYTVQESGWMDATVW
ncbi:hypothetical protein PC123_g19160 [Phytophthora cactorum]|nr:hypothetical protein PC123_g19160 [Phytophthora cactorum]